jgi:hypothetical protein
MIIQGICQYSLDRRVSCLSGEPEFEITSPGPSIRLQCPWAESKQKMLAHASGCRRPHLCAPHELAGTQQATIRNRNSAVTELAQG